MELNCLGGLGWRRLRGDKSRGSSQRPCWIVMKVGIFVGEEVLRACVGC